MVVFMLVKRGSFNKCTVINKKVVYNFLAANEVTRIITARTQLSSIKCNSLLVVTTNIEWPKKCGMNKKMMCAAQAPNKTKGVPVI